jgi:hypothetical protein
MKSAIADNRPLEKIIIEMRVITQKLILGTPDSRAQFFKTLFFQTTLISVPILPDPHFSVFFTGSALLGPDH